MTGPRDQPACCCVGCCSTPGFLELPPIHCLLKSTNMLNRLAAFYCPPDWPLSALILNLFGVDCGGDFFRRMASTPSSVERQDNHINPLNQIARGVLNLVQFLA